MYYINLAIVCFPDISQVIDLTVMYSCLMNVTYSVNMPIVWNKFLLDMLLMCLIYCPLDKLLIMVVYALVLGGPQSSFFKFIIRAINRLITCHYVIANRLLTRAWYSLVY